MNTTRALALFLALALLGFALLALSTPTARAADPVIIRVTTSGTTTWPCGDASNWSNACALQTALTRSVAGSELWVAAGTYTPTTTDVDPRTATFQLRDGIALYGGFAGGETLRAQRNFTANDTILSGDLNGDDNDNMRYDEVTRAENSYHVVTGSGVTNNAVLDGFTVAGGNSSENSDPNYRGGGMYNNGGSPTLTNVTFISNTASSVGGGIYNFSSGPSLTNVTFASNAAAAGGGMANESNSNPTLTNVTLTNNLAYYDGGGMLNSVASPTLTNVTFFGNSADGYGGGICNWSGNPTLTNVTFISNTASSRGGGMYDYSSNLVLTNVTFSGNTADPYANSYGGGMYNDNSSSVLTNVTFSGNSAYLGGGMEGVLSNSTLNSVTFVSNTATGAYGGMVIGGGSATLTNVTFSGNSAPYGGGMGNETKSMTVTNVTFSGNTATNTGGGMLNYEGSATLTNVTFSGNTAGQNGGGMHNWLTSSLTIRNTIFWGNTAPSNSQIGNDSMSTASLSDSVVQGGCPGSGTTCSVIVASDPHLGTLGNYGGATETLPLLPGSSAIDTGNDAVCPATDQRGVLRPQGAHCDIGAYEAQATLKQLNLPLIKR